MIIENHAFHGVSLILHRLKSKLKIISSNMDAIIKVKESFPQLACGVSISENCFGEL